MSFSIKGGPSVPLVVGSRTDKGGSTLENLAQTLKSVVSLPQLANVARANAPRVGSSAEEVSSFQHQFAKKQALLLGG